MTTLQRFRDRTGTPADETRRVVAIASCYGAQGLGYAAVITALPSTQQRWGIDETIVALLILGTCVAAGAGSLLSNSIAVRRGSRVGLRAALTVQAVTILAMALAPSFTVFVLGILAYGIGLGLMDGSQNMQGVAAERDLRRPLMGRFYASYTAASIIGALCMSGFLASTGAVTGALAVAAGVHVAVAVGAPSQLPRDRSAPQTANAAVALPSLPTKRIFAVGAIILAIFMLDSAVSTWGTTYLQEGLMATVAIAPLGYAVYQGAILAARVVTDALESRLGRARLGLIALLIGVLGAFIVAFIPTVGGAITGFALAGLATGAVVPLAFSAAGTLMPERSDEIISRMNLFNYGGAVAGGVIIGLVASGAQIGIAFLIPGVALLALAPLLRVFRQPATSSDAGER